MPKDRVLYRDYLHAQLTWSQEQWFQLLPAWLPSTEAERSMPLPGPQFNFLQHWSWQSVGDTYALCCCSSLGSKDVWDISAVLFSHFEVDFHLLFLLPPKLKLPNASVKHLHEIEMLLHTLCKCKLTNLAGVIDRKVISLYHDKWYCSMRAMTTI